MTYILLTNDELAKLHNGEEICCSLNGMNFALMLDDAFKATYLGDKDKET